MRAGLVRGHRVVERSPFPTARGNASARSPAPRGRGDRRRPTAGGTRVAAASCGSPGRSSICRRAAALLVEQQAQPLPLEHVEIGEEQPLAARGKLAKIGHGVRKCGSSSTENSMRPPPAPWSAAAGASRRTDRRTGPALRPVASARRQSRRSSRVRGHSTYRTGRLCRRSRSAKCCMDAGCRITFWR